MRTNLPEEIRHLTRAPSSRARRLAIKLPAGDQGTNADKRLAGVATSAVEILPDKAPLPVGNWFVREPAVSTLTRAWWRSKYLSPVGASGDRSSWSSRLIC